MGASNLGQTALKRSGRRRDPMHSFDRLPPELRSWIGQAALPWSPDSVRRAFDKAMRRTRNPATALKELDQIEQRLLAKDAVPVWGATRAL